MLWLKARRDLRALGVRGIVIAVVIAAGAGTCAGIFQALENVESTRDTFYADFGLADLDVRLTEKLPESALVARAVNGGAAVAETRLVIGANLETAAGSVGAEVVAMRPDATLGRLQVLSGSGLDGLAPDEVLLEADYAGYTGVQIGDSLSVTMEGLTASWRVAGLVRSPEYLLATSNPDYLIPQRGSLAVVFLPLDRLQEALGIGSLANDLVTAFPTGVGPVDRASIAGGLPVAGLVKQEDQYSLRFTEADVKSFSTFAPVVGGVFAAAGLLLVMLSLLRLVHRQQRELGAMLALGYRKRAVIGSVLLIAAALATAGALLSIAVTAGVSRLVATEYAHTVGFPAVKHALTAGPVVLSVTMAMVVTMAGALIPTTRIVRLAPAEAMRGETPSSFKIPGWAVATSNRLGTAGAYGLRSLIRRPLLTAATVVSVAAAIGLGAALHIVASSANSATDAAFDGESWTHAVDLARPIGSFDAVDLAVSHGAEQAEAISKGLAQAAAGERVGPVQIVGLPSDPMLTTLEIVSGTGPAPGFVAVSEQVANELQVDLGDPLQVETPSLKASLTVAGAVRTPSGRNIYLDPGEAAELLGFPGMTSSLLVVADTDAIEAILNDPDVRRVASRADAQEGTSELVSELTGLIDVLLAISLGVGALFLVSANTLAYLDREGEFATLRAIGYGRRHVTTIVGSESLVQVVAAIVLSGPAGLLFAWPLLWRIGQAWFHVPMAVAVSDFALVIPALGLAVLVAAFSARRLLRVNIAGVVRARLIG